MSRSVIESVNRLFIHSFIHSVSHSLSQSVSQSFSLSVRQSVNHSFIHSVSQSVSQSVSRSVSQSVTQSFSVISFFNTLCQKSWFRTLSCDFRRHTLVSDAFVRFLTLPSDCGRYTLTLTRYSTHHSWYSGFLVGNNPCTINGKVAIGRHSHLSFCAINFIIFNEPPGFVVVPVHYQPHVVLSVHFLFVCLHQRKRSKVWWKINVTRSLVRESALIPLACLWHACC